MSVSHGLDLVDFFFLEERPEDLLPLDLVLIGELVLESEFSVVVAVLLDSNVAAIDSLFGDLSEEAVRVGILDLKGVLDVLDIVLTNSLVLLATRDALVGPIQLVGYVDGLGELGVGLVEDRALVGLGVPGLLLLEDIVRIGSLRGNHGG